MGRRYFGASFSPKIQNRHSFWIPLASHEKGVQRSQPGRVSLEVKRSKHGVLPGPAEHPRHSRVHPIHVLMTQALGELANCVVGPCLPALGAGLGVK